MIRQLTYGITKRQNCTALIQILEGPYRPTALVGSRGPVFTSGSASGQCVKSFVSLTPSSRGRTGYRIKFKTMAESEGHHHTKKMTREEAIKTEKEKYLKMTLSEKRKMYKCKERFKTLDCVPTWPAYYKNRPIVLDEKTRQHRKPRLVNTDFNEKISIWKGDITSLEIDAIVNAANNSLLGGGGVDGAIHSAAGSSLRAECATLHGCETGDAKISGGYKMPAKYIIHTVGPIGKDPKVLHKCYQRSLTLMMEKNLTSIAFPCISTGIYGYPNESAVHVALETVRDFLEENENSQKVKRVIFCLYLPVDVELYETYMQIYFPLPLEEPSHKASANGKPEDKESSATEKESNTETDNVKLQENEKALQECDTDAAAPAELEDKHVDMECQSPEKPTDESGEKPTDESGENRTDNPGDEEEKVEDEAPTGMKTTSV